MSYEIKPGPGPGGTKGYSNDAPPPKVIPSTPVAPTGTTSTTTQTTNNP